MGAAPPTDELRWLFVPTGDGRTAAELCASRAAALAGAPQARTVACDVAAVRAPTLATVDLLARLRLTTARLGRGFRLDGAAPRLLRVLELTGLADVLGAQAAAGTNPAGPGPAGANTSVAGAVATGTSVAGTGPAGTSAADTGAADTGAAGMDGPGRSAGRPVGACSGLQERREAEQREQPVGVQEVVHSDDLAS